MMASPPLSPVRILMAVINSETKTAWNNCSFHCGTITYCMQLQLFQYLILTFRLYESVSNPYLISVASIHRKGLHTKVHRPHRHTFIFIYVSYYIPLKKIAKGKIRLEIHGRRAERMVSSILPSFPWIHIQG